MRTKSSSSDQNRSKTQSIVVDVFITYQLAFKLTSPRDVWLAVLTTDHVVVVEMPVDVGGIRNGHVHLEARDIPESSNTVLQVLK